MSGILAVLLVLGAGPACWAQGTEGTLHDDESRLSETLERRAQRGLDALFGPGRASVQVRVSLALTPGARDWLARALRVATKGGSRSDGYDWSWLAGAPEPEEKAFVLPGYPAAEVPGKAVPSARPGMPAAPQAAPEADAAVLRVFGTEVSRIAARVTLDSALPADADAGAAAVVREAAGILDSRGDTVAVERAPLPIPWRMLLRRPEAAADAAFKSLAALLGFAGLVTLLMLARSFRLGLESASARLAAALGRPGERSLDLNLGGEAKLERLAGASEGGPLAGLPGDAAFRGPADEDEDEPPPFFAIEAEQAPKLFHLLKDQAPEHTALVIPYLKPETREAFLALLPRERTAEVLGAMVPVRYVDPELIKTLRAELERRIEGVVGGVQGAVHFLQGLPSVRRGELLRLLRESDPEAASAVRELVLLLEDLERLSPADLSILVGEVAVEDLAAVSAGLPPTFMSALVAALPRRSAQVYAELVQLGGASQAERGPQARESLLRRAEALIAEGRIKRPSQFSARVSAEMKP